MGHCSNQAMNLNLSRGALLVVFLVFLMAQIVIIYSVGVANRVFVDEEMALITQVLSIYSVQLAVILGGMFAMKKTALPQATPFLVLKRHRAFAYVEFSAARRHAFVCRIGCLENPRYTELS